jgi:Tol biopolymer transport system component
MSMSTRKAEPADPSALERQHKRQRRWSMGKTVGALAVVAAIGLASVASSIFGALGRQNATTPAAERPSVAAGTSTEAQPGVTRVDRTIIDSVPKVDYVIDLNTGVMTPLPQAIIRSLGESGERGLYPSWASRYAASPDGSLLAYVGTGDEGSPQIFIAGIDGTGVRQVTHDLVRASSPAWSPDGTTMAFEGRRGLFVLDIATGESTPIAVAGRVVPGWAQPQFTPDGASLVYADGAVLRTVPIDGGKSKVLIGRSEGMGHAGNGSLSPDGSLVTMMGHEIGGPGAIRFVANADGTDLRSIPGGSSNPAGTWSPEGRRIVCSDYDGKDILVVDIATEETSLVAKGNGAIWLDRHTLLVEVS